MEPPVKPGPSDCCNSGCNPCILDIYEEQLRKYECQLKNKSRILNNHVHCLSLTSYSIFSLKSVEKHTKDTYFYTFQYLRDKNKQGIKKDGIFYEPGQHFLIKAQNSEDQTEFTRAYTPIPIENQELFEFTIVIKLYKQGKMSKYLKKLETNSETLWRGPYGQYKSDYSTKYMLFIAQGTGIAPIYAVAKDMVEYEECYTFLTLFFCCDSENVLLRNELMRLKDYWNFKYELFVSKRNESFVEKYKETCHFKKLEYEDILEYFVGKKNEDVKVLICGSDSFTQNMKNCVLQCSILESNIFVF